MIQSDFGNDTCFHYKGIRYLVTKQIRPFGIQARDLATGSTVVFDKAELLESLPSGQLEFEGSSRLLARKNPPPRDPGDLTAGEKEESLRRFEIIKFLLGHSTRAKAKRAAEKAGMHVATIYRWLRRYKDYGVDGPLPWHHKKGPRGQSKINTRSEEILRNLIESNWPDPRKITVGQIYHEVVAECAKEGIKSPSYKTVRRRIQMIKKSTMADREGKKAYEKQFLATPGSFSAARSLQYVEIDHKLLDVIVVDPKSGEALGRPWLTLGIDLFSRAVWGFFISLDRPSFHSVALCLLHGIWLKKETCKKHGVAEAWPIYGIPEFVHVDNGKELAGGDLQHTCLNLGCQIQHRKTYTPRYGGVVERFFRTLDQMLISRLHGKTFSNPQERGEYPSEKKAAITLAELETLLYKTIDIYLNSFHSGINTTPLEKWKEGLVLRPARMPTSLDSLKHFLMPERNRQVERTGINFQNFQYWDNSLEDKVGETINFRYSPADLSQIYLEDEQGHYVPIAVKPEFRELATLTRWEIKKIQAIERVKGRSLQPKDLHLRKLELRDDIRGKAVRRKRARLAFLKIHDNKSDPFALSVIQPKAETQAVAGKGAPRADCQDDPMSTFEVEVG